VSDFGVISDVSSTLESVLSTSLGTLNPAVTAEVHDLQGNIPLAPARVTLFLFEVSEDPSAKNRPRIRGAQVPDITLRKPPLALVLRYLLTPWSGDRATDQRILGRVLQTMYDGATVSGLQLQGGLAGSDQALKIALSPLTLEERTRIWHAIQRPYRLSVTYEVRVVNLDSELVDVLKAVRERELGFEVSETQP